MTAIQGRVEERTEREAEKTLHTGHGLGRRSFFVAMTTLIVAGMVAAVSVVATARNSSEPSWQGWGLEQTELAVIEARLAPSVTATASSWALEQPELEMIAGRGARPAPARASQPWGMGDLDPIELDFITGRSTEPSRWDLSPEETALISPRGF